jgi:hypothetical protein
MAFADHHKDRWCVSAIGWLKDRSTSLRVAGRSLPARSVARALTKRFSETELFVIIKRESEEFDTHILQGFGADPIDAVIVFADPDRAGRFLRDSGRSNQETVAKLTSAATLAFVSRLADESADQMLVNPVWCSDEGILALFVFRR